jgi:hypothetical protein
VLQLENRTPFAATMLVLPDRTGIDTLFVVVKATVSLRPRLGLVDLQVPPTLADEYYGDPAASSLRSASDVHLGKPGTDVLLVGSAHAPQGRAVVQMTVAMSVAGRQQSIRVTGDRAWRGGSPSEAQPFVSMPLMWERAFGGLQRRGDDLLAETNPVGRGATTARSSAEADGQPLPNLESPNDPLERLGQSAAPVCFAPVAPWWQPRRRYAGTYDERWQRHRAPFLPEDFDPRFFHCAAGGFAFDRYLQPGERVQALGVMPDGPVDFAIPDARLQVEVTVGGTTHRPPVNLETLALEPDENRACFTWRAAVPCDRQALRIDRVVIGRE